MTAPELATDRTERWLTAVATGDFTALDALLAEDVTLVMRMTLDGAQDPGQGLTGRDQVAGYFRTVDQLMPRRDRHDLRITASATGETTFVQFDGDFTTADGRPYRNVYLFRLDWRAGLLAAIEEYANPLTFIAVFPERAAAVTR